MSSLRAISDSNPTRTQMRLVVLGQWVRAGLELTRGASAGRGLIGGAVALWRVLQAIRLAMQLVQRFSELREVLSHAAPDTASAQTLARSPAPCSDDLSGVAACLRQTLIEITQTIRDVLGLAPHRPRRPSAGRAVDLAAESELPHPRGHRPPSRGRPPDRPPGLARSRVRRRRSRAPGALKTAHTPIAAPAIGRFRLGAG